MTSRKRHPVAPAAAAFASALRAGAAETRRDGACRYARVREDFRGVPRGVVCVDGRIVPDYPRIPRLVALRAGLDRYLRTPFRVEEKIDGFNVRVFRCQDGWAAVTRSGVLCPFTQDRLPDLVGDERLQRLFRKHPDLVLCAEVAGRGNPYMAAASRHGGDDVALYVFDLMRLDTVEFLSPAERDALVNEYDLPRAPALGTFRREDNEALNAEILRLDTLGAEGVVLKPESGGDRFKYVCPSINVADIGTEAALALEVPGEFYTHRLARLVIALRELGGIEDLDALGGEFGRLLATGFNGAVSDLEDHGTVTQEVTVRLREARSADALIAHLNHESRTIRAEELGRRFNGTHWELSLRKVFRRSTDRLRELLDGQAVID